MIEWAEVAPGTVLMATSETAWLHRLAPLDPFARPMGGPGAVETTRTLLDAAIGFFQHRRLAQAAPALTREGYAERLVGYYHGGHTTPPLLRRAAQRFEGAGRPELVAWALATAEDEDHDHFALADLAELGYPPGVVPTLPCPPFMAALIAYFEACVDGPEPVACLGYIYAVERSSSLIQPSYIEAIDRLLGPGVNATRCLRWHSSMGAEPAHVDRLLGTVAALPAGDRCCVVRAVYETSRILFADPSEPPERRPPMADFAQVWQEICATAHTDEEFKRNLMANANEILKGKGFKAPDGFKFKVVENSPATVMHLVLPAKEEEIAQVAPAGNETISQYHASVV